MAGWGVVAAGGAVETGGGGWKGKQEDGHGAEFEMENRAEWKLEWNGKSEAREMEWKGKNLGNGKGSRAWEKMEQKHRKRKYGI